MPCSFRHPGVPLLVSALPVALALGVLTLACSRSRESPQQNAETQGPHGSSSAATGEAPSSVGAASSVSAAPAASVANPDSARDIAVPTSLPKPKSEAEDLAQSSSPEAAERIIGEYGFPSYPGMRHLCGQRGFLPGGGSMNFAVFTTADPWQEVRANLGTRLGRNGYVESAGFIGWRLPGPKTPTRELELVPKGRSSLADRCATRPSPETETVIVVRRW